MNDIDYMKIAIKEARFARDNDGAVGSVLVQDDKIIARAGSEMMDNGRYKHAEEKVITKTD